MSKVIASFVAVSLLVSMQAPAYASDRGKTVQPVGVAGKVTGHKGNAGKFALGLAIGVGIVGAVIASRSQADYGPRKLYRADFTPDHNMCRVWLTDCRYGSDRACMKYDNRC